MAFRTATAGPKRATTEGSAVSTLSAERRLRARLVRLLGRQLAVGDQRLAKRDRRDPLTLRPGNIGWPASSAAWARVRLETPWLRVLSLAFVQPTKRRGVAGAVRSGTGWNAVDAQAAHRSNRHG